MASYNLKYNSDDSVVRHLIIGLLADLNNKLYFYRQVDANTRKAIDVPFYYSITGDDQFLRDNFLFSTPSGPDCHPDVGFADGNYDVVPRGVARVTGMAIDSGSLVNKRNVGSYTKMNSQGAMEGYQSEFEMIPIELSFDIEILVSSTLDAFKITEMMVKTLYKSNIFNVEVGHLDEATYRLNSYYAIPEDFEIQNPIDFTFDDKDKYKITFPIVVNSFIPAFEFDSETHVGNRMFEIVSSVVSKGSLEDETMSTNRGDTTMVIDSTLTSKPSQSNSSFAADTSFNASDRYIPNAGSSNSTPMIIDANQQQSPLVLSPGTVGQESVIIAANGSIQIDTSNFEGPQSIEILAGGAISIKYYQDFWYVVGHSNSNVTY